MVYTSLCHIGETCNDCLVQHISPDRTDICVGDIIVITITSQAQTAVTLLVNESVCHSGSGGNNLVTCREQNGGAFQTTAAFSYNVTAMNTGVLFIRAHATYHGAQWYSTSEILNIRECDTPEGECDYV